MRRHPFEGVLHNMERRYKESNPAQYAKSWRVHQQPPLRLVPRHPSREEARNVFVEDTTLPEISDLSIGHCDDLLPEHEAPAASAPRSPKVLKEIGDRLKFR